MTVMTRLPAGHMTTDCWSHDHMQTHSSVDGGELGLATVHAHGSVTVRHPHSCMLCGWLLVGCECECMCVCVRVCVCVVCVCVV